MCYVDEIARLFPANRGPPVDERKTKGELEESWSYANVHTYSGGTYRWYVQIRGTNAGHPVHEGSIDLSFVVERPPCRCHAVSRYLRDRS